VEDCDAIYSESRHDVVDCDAIYSESRHDVVELAIPAAVDLDGRARELVDQRLPLQPGESHCAQRRALRVSAALRAAAAMQRECVPTKAQRLQRRVLRQSGNPYGVFCRREPQTAAASAS
jgi:hypothetical protein